MNQTLSMVKMALTLDMEVKLAIWVTKQVGMSDWAIMVGFNIDKTCLSCFLM